MEDDNLGTNLLLIYIFSRIHPDVWMERRSVDEFDQQSTETIFELNKAEI